MTLDPERDRKKRSIDSSLAMFEEETPTVNIGILLIVVSLKTNGSARPIPFLWTTVENKSKPETEKVAGQVSVPSETRKVGEEQEETLLAALAEFTDDEAVIADLRVPPGSPYFHNGISVGGNPVDVAVVFYAGSANTVINPVDPDEVSVNGWRSLEQLVGEDPDKIRSTFRKVIELDSQTGFLRSTIESYQALGGAPISSLIPATSDKGFSIRDFHARREEKPDILVTPRVSL